jgi:hypothetical protein
MEEALATVPVRVPQRAVPSLRDLADLTNDQADELLAGLGKISPIVSRHSLSVRLQTPLPHFDKKQSEALVTALFNLWAASNTHNWDLRDVAQTAAQETNVKIDEGKQASFTERLYTALTLPSIAELANAADIATEYDAVFHLARCFTDIRPVFERETGSNIKGAVVVHNLKFDYFITGGDESLTLTLSNEDLESLIDILNRAKEEGARVDEFLKDSGLRLFEFSQHLGSSHGSQD